MAEQKALHPASQESMLSYLLARVDEEDWLAGIDLYKNDRVKLLKKFENVISCQVQSFVDLEANVNMKLHPNRQLIQWAECTCRKNRKYGRFCEHITALILVLEEEKNQKSFLHLQPFKTLNSSAQERQASNGVAHATQAEETFLKHFDNNITSMLFDKSDSVLQVQVEMRPGKSSSYQLDIDMQAHLLEHIQKKKSYAAIKEFRNFRIFKAPAVLGSYFSLNKDEKLIAKRVLIINRKDWTGNKTTTLPYAIVKGTLQRSTPSLDEIHKFYVFDLDQNQNFIGKEFFYTPKLGYWKIDRSQVHHSWYESPHQQIIADDEAYVQIQSNFTDQLSLSPILIEEKLNQLIISEHTHLAKIKILQEKDGWFYIDPQYQNGDISFSMTEIITQYVKQKKKFLKAKNKWFKVPELITQYQWELDESSKCLKVRATDIIRIKAELDQSQKESGSPTQPQDSISHFSGRAELIDKLHKLTVFDPNMSVPELSHTKLNLRKYQTEGYAWLWWLYKNSLHGLLADDMGLGKTHQAMALMSAVQLEQPRKPLFLIVCPTTVLDHWEEKIKNFSPNLNILKYHGANREHLLRRIPTHTAILTSYGVLQRDIVYLTQYRWEVVLLDEAHFVKNNATATYKACCLLSSQFRVCLTGTPMENRLQELKNIFDFLVPGYLGHDKFFQRQFINPIEKNKNLEKEHSLQKLISPFKLRRTKKQVLDDLPEKIEDLRFCQLSEEQAQMYRSILDLKASQLLTTLNTENAAIPYLHILSTLHLLKQVCNHPALIKKDPQFHKYKSAKFDLFKEILTEALDSNLKVVVFSQYIGMIDILQRYCAEEKIAHVTMTGQTQNRGQVISQFQNDPEIKVFLGSLLAGGIGIDLTAASVVIHYDRWWNPSKENQATDRVHRIGQKNFVQVIKLITRGTLEEKINLMIEQKAKLFSSFMEKDEDVFRNLNRQELLDLLS